MDAADGQILNEKLILLLILLTLKLYSITLSKLYFMNLHSDVQNQKMSQEDKSTTSWARAAGPDPKIKTTASRDDLGRQ